MDSQTKRPVVYIVQEMKRWQWDPDLQEDVLKPVHDMTPAAVYGDLKVLLDGAPIGIRLQGMIRTLREKLRGFTDDDYILPVGDPLAMGTAIALAAERNYGRVKVLRWDGRARAYIEAQMDLAKSTAQEAV